MTIVIDTEIIELAYVAGTCSTRRHVQLTYSIISVSITIVINFAIYTYHYLVYHNTDEGRRRCRNISVVCKET